MDQLLSEIKFSVREHFVVYIKKQ